MDDNNQEQQELHTNGPNGSGAQVQGDATTEADHAAELDLDLKKLQDERDALFEQVARVQADFRNAQKRLEAEKQQAIQFANTRLLQALIPVIDSFERALEVDAAKSDPAALLKGMQVVYDQLLHAIQQQHVEVIAPKSGEMFDPNLHQAVVQQPAQDGAAGEPTVTQLFQKGYVMHGRTLRPAQVAVSKESAE